MSSSSTIAVFGIYSTPESTEAAFVDLMNSGLIGSDVSILLPDNENTRAFAAEKNAKASASAAPGVSASPLAVLSELPIPGVGPMIAGGPILAALMGVSAGGGTLGGLVGALIGMGFPEFEAKLYDTAVKDGCALLSIHCSATDQADNAKDCLERTGARDVACASEAILGDVQEDEGDAGNVFNGDQLSGPGTLAESLG